MSVTAPAGFRASGVACGIKAGPRADLALVATEDGRAVPAAAVFTTNKATAAPVQVSRAHLHRSGGRAAAVVLSSGNANAATGEVGRRDATRMAELAAEGVGCATDEVLVCSTGLIGYYLPMPCLEKGVPAAVADLAGGEEASLAAARAIMTTDTRAKLTLVDRGGFRVGGIAKGAAMLAPDMATMLAVLTTDASAEPEALQRLLRQAVSVSFNRLIVDGCTSTNDTVAVLASGRAGRVDEDSLLQSLTEACHDLAEQMAADAEGITRTAVIRVSGATSDHHALVAARRVAESQLVQCSLHGSDPYWGRIVSELGAAGVDFDPDRVSVAYGGVTVCRAGVAAEHDSDAVARHMSAPRVEISADLGLGSGTAAVLTTDLSPEYIAENQGTS
ncbi:MAG TPA: bifunctional glutamate N-acetyltransferase/amino-acid acetyltransferase ArgJ [Acidimicrobiales bacterium]|nr:bifunctional glutamate N-acetyltransferase/amino-acid acetyltransferase ArgJ [Acidimicrobiales bacterium]